MDYLKIESDDNSVTLKGVKNFDIKQTLECGQCFRWEKVADNIYVGVAFGRVLEIEQVGNDVILHNTNEDEFYKIWLKYFNLDTDYTEIKEKLSQDATLSKAIEYGSGIRVLNQEPFELVISFIISARNSVPMISKTVNEISRRWGKKIEYKGKDYYEFPKKEVLASITEIEMKDAGGSFRSRYIIDTSDKITNCEFIKEGLLSVEDNNAFLAKYDLETIRALDADECHKALQNYSGIGAKVADCIMLFSMEKTSGFPVDRWVKRAMMHFYGAGDLSLPKIRVFARERFGEFAGAAQQYLFYYAKEKGILL
ncbi:DNA glycosylase [uncultured Clostridium sp.]|jgi:N-glycosylase/DNA lyase|uniref:DNA-3-methyladenine glycosylase family protein n=1 Tax=uncultured Clostridium sp. TaxID=59620 RepID=UPI00262D3CB1|nr:DNA glycosylase [uncultured Clostridium sp.]